MRLSFCVEFAQLLWEPIGMLWFCVVALLALDVILSWVEYCCELREILCIQIWLWILALGANIVLTASGVWNFRKFWKDYMKVPKSIVGQSWTLYVKVTDKGYCHLMAIWDRKFDGFEGTFVFHNAWFLLWGNGFDPLRFVTPLLWLLSILSRI